jgi:hypothetical protein
MQTRPSKSLSANEKMHQDCMTASHAKPSRMNVSSSAERIELFNIALEVNHHHRDDVLNDFMHSYVTNTIDATDINLDDELLNRRVSALFD